MSMRAKSPSLSLTSMITLKSPAQFGVMSIPTLIIFKNGLPASNIVGFRPKPELKKSIDTALAG